MGGVVCEKCGTKTKGSYPIGEGVRKAVAYVIKNEGKRIFGFGLSEEVLKQLEGIMELYVKVHLGIELKSLEFLKSL